MKGFPALCYNPAMIRRWSALAGSVMLISSGCVSMDDQRESGPPQVTYAQLKTSPETLRGQTVTFGGKVLSAKRLKQGTRIEILQLPLDPSLKPTPDLTKSQGRFVAMKTEFLDPATIPSGTFVTVTGDVAGSVTLPLDEMEYLYPVVEIKNLRVWPAEEEKPPRLRPYPYMVPGPSWRPWPYW
jgi:outer membrane lipoprotein